MNELLELFENWALDEEQKKMKKDKQYCELEEQKTQAFRDFCSSYSEDAQWDCINLLDLEHMLSEDEKIFLFQFGIRLGLELGRLRF